MPKVLMKNGEIKEIPDEQMLSFLQQNRDLIQDRYSPRKRSIKRPKLSPIESTSTK